MKVIHFLSGPPNPNVISGVNKVVHQLATRQCREGIDAEVWAVAGEADSARYERTYVLRTFRQTRLRLRLDHALTEAVGALPPDAMFHFHSVFVPEFAPVAALLARRGVRWVLTPHSGYNQISMRRLSWLKSLYLNVLDRRLVYGAQALHGIGAVEAEELSGRFPEQRVVNIPNGQDLDELHWTAVTAPPGVRPLFGYCGRLATRQKGLDILLNAMARYVEGGGQGLLWLIGDGADRHALETQAARLQLTDRVRFCGALFGEHKFTHLAQLDVFVHTSRWEAIATAVIEAAALSKPLLLTAGVGFGQYHRAFDFGWIARDDSADAVAEAMRQAERAYQRGELEPRQRAARALVEREFDIRRVVERISAELYRVDFSGQSF